MQLEYGSSIVLYTDQQHRFFSGKLIQDCQQDEPECGEDETEQCDGMYGPEYDAVENDDHDMHVEWFDDSESESSGDECDVLPGSTEDGGDVSHHHGSRNPAVHLQPEYAKLRSMNLHTRPAGCYLGIDPVGKVWRAATSTSSHYGRSYGLQRSSWQALLRVMELMLDAFISENSENPDMKLIKHQLSRIRKLRKEEPPHKD